MSAARSSGVTLAALEDHADAVAVLRERNHEDFARVGAQRTPGIAVPEPPVRFAIFDSGRLAGTGGLSNISRGAMQTATVGILLDAATRGRGVGTAAVRLMCAHGFEELCLHRLQAGIQPTNPASLRIFERNGFERIGLARAYLLIDGVWRDHVLVQKLAP